jgi:hypothetical protein
MITCPHCHRSTQQVKNGRLDGKSRCFSRSIAALRRAVKLFVHAWNRHQLHQRAFPRYACHVSDFVCP